MVYECVPIREHFYLLSIPFRIHPSLVHDVHNLYCTIQTYFYVIIVQGAAKN